MQSDKEAVLNRVATIEGHRKGIRKMVEDDQYCVFESALLEGHLATCVPTGFKDGRDDQMSSRAWSAVPARPQVTLPWLPPPKPQPPKSPCPSPA